jgi:hypothetical protein
MLELRDYQIDSIADIGAAFAQHRRLLFVLPTGGGKTIIFAFITTHAAAKGNRVVIVAHRAEIVDQISRVSLDSQRRSLAERQKSAPGLRKCPACDAVFARSDRSDDCGVAGCLFAAPAFRERPGDLEEVVSPPWARGIDIRGARLAVVSVAPARGH